MKKFTFILCYLTFSINCFASDFESWKKEYINRASKRGLPKAFLEKILKDIKPNQKVLDKFKNQVILDKEKKYNEFIKRWLREDKVRITRGKSLLKTHSELLEKIEKEFNVDKEVIVALWGTETYYGEITGDYDIISSLATLSFEGRRRKFYETQLNATLRLLKQNKVKREHLIGSWAGATGQCQFMPSNISAYGIDYDRDGEINLWSSLPDIFASMAKLLKSAGWKYRKSIGDLAIAPPHFKGDLNKYRTPKQYNNLGFKHLNGQPFKDESWSARRASEIPMKNSPIVLRGSNYTPILKWNRSSLFAAFNILLIDGFDH